MIVTKKNTDRIPSNQFLIPLHTGKFYNKSNNFPNIIKKCLSSGGCYFYGKDFKEITDMSQGKRKLRDLHWEHSLNEYQTSNMSYKTDVKFLGDL